MNLTGNQIKNTYPQLLNIVGTTLTDGTGSAITSLPISCSLSSTSSYAITSSYSINSSNIVNSIVLSGQTGSIGPNSLYTNNRNTAGFYRLSGMLLVTTTGSGGTLTMNLNWIDDSLSMFSNAILNMPLNVKGATSIDVFCLDISSSAALQYSITASSVVGTPQYKLRLVLEQIQ